MPPSSSSSSDLLTTLSFHNVFLAFVTLLPLSLTSLTFLPSALHSSFLSWPLLQYDPSLEILFFSLILLFYAEIAHLIQQIFAQERNLKILSTGPISILDFKIWFYVCLFKNHFCLLVLTLINNITSAYEV